MGTRSTFSYLSASKNDPLPVTWAFRQLVRNTKYMGTPTQQRGNWPCKTDSPHPGGGGFVGSPPKIFNRPRAPDKTSWVSTTKPKLGVPE